MRQLILLTGSTLALSSCETLTIQNRNPCFVNGVISLGSTCANTIGPIVIEQKTVTETLELLEARPDHPPAVYQSAQDYGEETVELETACRILGDKCSYALQSTIKNRKKILKALESL